LTTVEEMREIVLDTETTGLDPAQGHRLVEIAGVELRYGVSTGQTFHVYLNPQRDMPDEAYRVHGLSAEFLSNHPLFADIVDDFLSFIGDSPIVIHNAEFDMRFLNAELDLIKRPRIPFERAIDSLILARRKHPGASNSLDALCARYRIDASRRVKHGALIDAQILAEVYSELTGGRQSALILVEHETKNDVVVQTPSKLELNRNIEILLDADEIEDHARFLETFDSTLWRGFLMAP
jgi:DNA polymerase III subunit epsilon